MSLCAKIFAKHGNTLRVTSEGYETGHEPVHPLVLRDLRQNQCGQGCLALLESYMRRRWWLDYRAHELRGSRL